jgi:flagellar biosynthetic protein FliP
VVIALALWLAVGESVAWSQAAAPVGLPRVTVGLEGGEGAKEVGTAVQVLFLLTVLSLAPSILIMVTSFTRFVIVFSFLRRALGTQQTPSNQVLIGLSLFMTFFVMWPVFQEVHDEALGPLLAGEIQPEMRQVESNGEIVTREISAFQIAVERSVCPLREFMWSQIGGKNIADVALFMNLAGFDRPDTPDDVPTHVLIPAFITSELKTAFQIGFIIFMPFLIIDMVTASVLMSMGMMQLPPIMISMPFKILLFVMVDGWRLLTESLMRGVLGR